MRRLHGNKFLLLAVPGKASVELQYFLHPPLPQENVEIEDQDFPQNVLCSLLIKAERKDLLPFHGIILTKFYPWHANWFHSSSSCLKLQNPFKALMPTNKGKSPSISVMWFISSIFSTMLKSHHPKKMASKYCWPRSNLQNDGNKENFKPNMDP